MDEGVLANRKSSSKLFGSIFFNKKKSIGNENKMSITLKSF